MVLDAIWVGMLFAFFAGFNPDNHFSLDESTAIVFIPVSALPLIYELVWAFAKKLIELRGPRR
jgi:hypothetical protein